MVSLVREWVLFILLFILSMGSRKAVLSAPRTLDMVPLGDDLQGGSNQGVKALSDHVLSSVRRWGAATTSLQIFVDEYALNEPTE